MTFKLISGRNNNQPSPAFDQGAFIEAIGAATTTIAQASVVATTIAQASAIVMPLRTNLDVF